jgi:PAS domain S-box-containing protein
VENKNDSLRALRLINKVLISETDQHILLNSLSQILLKEKGYFNIWIILTLHDIPVEPYYHAGFGTGRDSSFEPMARILKKGIMPPCAQKLTESKNLYIIDDLSHECKLCPFYETYKNRAGITRRLGSGKTSLGWISASVPKAFIEDKEEQDFFIEITDQISHALEILNYKTSQNNMGNKYNAFADTTSDGILEIDLQGHLISANKSSHSLLGPLLQERFGLSLEPLMNAENFRLFEESILTAQKEEKAVNRILEGKDWNSQIISLSISLYPRKSLTGVIIGFSIFLREVTETSKKLEDIKKSEERFFNMFRNAPLAYQSLDEEGRFLEVNDNWLELTGYERDEVLGHWFGDYLAPGYKEVFEQRFPLFKKRGQVHSEFYMVTKKGTNRYISFEGRIGYKEDGSFRQTHCVLTDVTERKRSEDAVKENEAYFRSIFEYIDSGIVIYEPFNDGEDFIFRDLNPAGQLMSKVQLADVKGRKVSEVFPGVKEIGLFDCLQKTHETGESIYLPVREYKDNRTSLVVENHISRLPSGNLLVIYDDRTKQAQMEQRLRQTEKMEAIGHLAGGIAHDFNNILTGILGYAELVGLKKIMDEDIQHYMKNIVSAGERAKKLVQQILSFSRQVPERNDIFFLIPVIQEALQFLRATIPASIHINTSFSEETNPILGDSTRIHEIMMNLCTNASHAMGEIGTLDVSLKEENVQDPREGALGHFQPGHYAVLTVRDNGSGMNKETLSHIFEPFFTTKSTGEGTGMGLSVVFGIIRNHKGNIIVNSIPDEGTEFQIYIPQEIKKNGSELSA